MQRDPETFAIIGAAMEVHRELGRGFLELVYQTAPALEFRERGVPYAAEVILPINYKSKLLTCVYRSDFICFNSVIVETKAIAQLTSADDAQLINQLKATGFHRGILLNFGAPSLEHRRLVLGLSDNLRKSAQSVDTLLRNLPPKFICGIFPR
jgi:GxxExxY protein